MNVLQSRIILETFRNLHRFYCYYALEIKFVGVKNMYLNFEDL